MPIPRSVLTNPQGIHPVNRTLKYAALAVFVGAAGAAHADSTETKGGLKVRTEDGRFEMGIGGRIMLDTYVVSRDEDATFGSGRYTDNPSGTFFRRARISFSGKAYGWEYLFVPDFSQNTGGIGANGQPAAVAGQPAPGQNTNAAPGSTVSVPGIQFQELYIHKKIGEGGRLFIGQFKPYRSLEELTSSNEITFMERPFTSASGIDNGRQWVTGVGYLQTLGPFLLGVDFYSLSASQTAESTGGTTNSGMGFGGRGVWAPFNSEGRVLHLAVSGGREDAENGLRINDAVRYGGRRGANTGTLTETAPGGTAELIAGELGAVFGPFFLQAEYARETFSQLPTAAKKELDADAYHVAASYFITGETKPYDANRGVFKSPKPINSFGAVEIAARYEQIRDSDEVAPLNIKKVSNITLGTNYYVNPSLRFMLNYNLGSAELVNGRKDEPESIAVRAHYYW